MGGGGVVSEHSEIYFVLAIYIAYPPIQQLPPDMIENRVAWEQNIFNWRLFATHLNLF
jgi:hypothetical protein